MFDPTVRSKSKTRLWNIAAVMLILALTLPAVVPVEARDGGEKPAAAAPLQGPVDAAEMEAFLDELLKSEMEENHIAGAAVSVVRDGRLFFAKGYGYADLDRHIPVSAEETVFKIGSVTKLFTWTAVMQLAEQGRLDLDADINTYLDFHIPDTFPQAITLRHLMTHTAGFEDLHADMVVLNEEDLAPEGEWLAAHLPARVLPPGEAAAYSNYGAALAGYIVARVSGESYSQYVQGHIFDPLGMKSSSAAWPISPDLSARESVGYAYADGRYQVFPRLIGQVDLFPAGIIHTTATDMARFMSAHLQDGAAPDTDQPDARILSEATTGQMHSTLYTADARMPGTTYGFFDFSDNGQRTIGHSGEAEPMEALLLLLPDQHLGVFVVYNSLGGDTLTRQHFGFQRAFFDHYFPQPATAALQPPTDFASRAGRFAGSYKMTRSADSTLEKFLSLSYPTVDVSNPGDGTLFIETPYGDWQVVEEAPLYFRQVEGPYHFLFREDERGRIAYLFSDYTPMMAFEKLNWYETPGFNLPLLMVCLLVCLSVLPVMVTRTIQRRARGGDRGSTMPGGARAALALMVWTSLLNLLFVAGNMLWGEQLVFGIPTAYKMVLGLGVLSALLTVGLLAGCALSWRERYWSAAFRLYYTLVTVSAAAFIWFLSFWNLLGWQY